VQRAAYAFNIPLRISAAATNTGSLLSAQAFLTVSVPNVIVEAVKQAETGDGWIVRLYETTGAAAEAALTFALPVSAAAETNAMEEEPRPIEVAEGRIVVGFRPFEIKTIFVKTAV
jgi:alpha-mannosidase